MANRSIAVQSGWVNLQGSLVYLRDFALDDWEAVQAYAADPAVVRYMSWGPNSPEETMSFVTNAAMLSREKSRTRFDLAIVRRTDDVVIGGAGIFIRPGREFEAEMGYCLRQDAWGQGYGSETARLLVHFGFHYLHMHRIIATCDPENVASARVLAKAGLRCEGLMREHMHTRTGWRDSLLFAILSSDTLPSSKVPDEKHKRCIFAVTELEPAERIESLRLRFDPLFGKVPTHVTLVFPFDLPLSNELVAQHLEVAVKDQPALQIDFDACRIGTLGYAYLPVRKGADALKSLYDKLNGGALQSVRFQQRFSGVFRPHLTIGRVSTPEAAWEAARAMAGAHRGLQGKINTLVLETILPDDCSRVEHTVQLMSK